MLVSELRNMVAVRLDAAKSRGESITTELMRTLVTTTKEFVDPMDHEGIDINALVKELEAVYNVHVGTWNSLENNAGHQPWLANHKGEAPWPFWVRYKRYLSQDKRLPYEVVERLDDITDDILGRLEDPSRPGPWDRRGLVAGQVQSGKTGNFIGLIAKAMDAGYKLIVVLAGIHNSLRSQTQARIDEGILGFDTRAFRLAHKADEPSFIGVGRLAGPRLYASSFTSSEQSGDFQFSVAQNAGVAPGGADPIVLVVKKNKSILTNLYKWATQLTKERDPATGELRVRGIPLLVIDDEADHASVNTSKDDPETDPSTINGLIRKFLNTFDRTAYVAYTATPFANIFIDPDEEREEFGQDLFPRSFIINLPASSTYVGPERVFGLNSDSSLDGERVQALNIVRDIQDHEGWLPDKHESSHRIDAPLPNSLEEAILLFLMAGAARRLRGQSRSHHSMLIHVTRYTDVQRQVSEQVQAFLASVTRRLQYGEGSNPVLRDRVLHLYERDLTPVTQELRTSEDRELVGDTHEFDELWAEMLHAARKTRVQLVNGTSNDALTYVDHPDGVSVIAVGGDKLSRGLTLEGLTISYYLRASRMYDTLMQMGRWFGYRPGYLDLCRLYTTPTLRRWYQRITGATAELQREFESMAAVQKTPEDFGLRVRQLPDGLLVTSPTKLRQAQRLRLSFSGQLSETVTFKNDDRSQNLLALERLTSELPSADTGNGSKHPSGYLWRGVPADTIVSFLDDYHADRAAFKARPQALIEYIREREASDELTTWTVLIANPSGEDRRRTTVPLRDGSPLRISHTRRADFGAAKGSGRYTVKRLVSPTDELIDLDKGSPDWKSALQHTKLMWELNPHRKPGSKAPTAPSGQAARLQRAPRNGVLLVYVLAPDSWVDYESQDDEAPFVGFALSFPESSTAKPVEYQVNKRLLRDQFGWGDDDFDQ